MRAGIRPAKRAVKTLQKWLSVNGCQTKPQRADCYAASPVEKSSTATQPDTIENLKENGWTLMASGRGTVKAPESRILQKRKERGRCASPVQPGVRRPSSPCTLQPGRQGPRRRGTEASPWKKNLQKLFEAFRTGDNETPISRTVANRQGPGNPELRCEEDNQDLRDLWNATHAKKRRIRRRERLNPNASERPETNQGGSLRVEPQPFRATSSSSQQPIPVATRRHHRVSNCQRINFCSSRLRKAFRLVRTFRNRFWVGWNRE